MCKDAEYWKALYEAERDINRHLQADMDAIDDFNIYVCEKQSEKLKRKPS